MIGTYGHRTARRKGAFPSMGTGDMIGGIHENDVLRDTFPQCYSLAIRSLRRDLRPRYCAAFVTATRHGSGAAQRLTDLSRVDSKCCCIVRHHQAPTGCGAVGPSSCIKRLACSRAVPARVFAGLIPAPIATATGIRIE